MRKFSFVIIILFYSFSSLNAQIKLQDGLVAFYPLNGNANDVSGNGNNGVLANGTPTQDRFGNNNSAILFNGTSTYILTPIDKSSFVNQISLCAWAKTLNGNYSGIVCSRYAFNIAAMISIDNIGQPFAYFSDGNPSNLINTSVGAMGVNLNDDKWHFIAVTFDGTNRKMYVDGILKNQLSNYSFSLYIQSLFKIGWDDLSGYQRFFNGKIDDVRIYKRSLNESEVLQLYNDNVTLTANKDISSNVLKLYPNPTKDFLNIDFGDYKNMLGYEVVIRNEIGIIAFLSPITQKSSIISVNNWAKGIYFIQITNSKGVIIETKKIIIG